jgi:hypothetical protein
MADTHALPCLRCGVEMMSAGTHKLHEGELSEFEPYVVRAGTTLLRLDLYFCPRCGHAEFIVPDVREEPTGVPDEAAAERPGEVLATDTRIAGDDGGMEDTWMCPCGELNYASYDKCLGCGAPKPQGTQG